MSDSYDITPCSANYNIDRVADRVMDELLGICRGVLADGDVNQDEAKFLLEWLGKNRMASDNVLMPALYSRLKDIFQDGVMDDDERQDLLSFLKHATGNNTVLENMTAMPSSLPLDDPQPDVVFTGHVFCFTGNFALGPRKACGQEVVSRSGIFKNTISKQLDYLVIGSIGSSSWIHSTHGRKIEKAIAYRKETGLAIISEDHWACAIC
ncbi:BRCT domain-containing protein [Desulfoplanes sp. PS50]